MSVLVLLFLCSGVSHHLALHKTSADFHAAGKEDSSPPICFLKV